MHYKKFVEERKDGIVFSIDVVPNFERELIGFEEGLKILSPSGFMRRIQKKVRLMYEVYFGDETASFKPHLILSTGDDQWEAANFLKSILCENQSPVPGWYQHLSRAGC